MELQIQDLRSGKASGTVSVSDEAFGAVFKETLVHQVVSAYLAGQRLGTKAQKSRAEVRGGGTKPWRQKGTGRARAGSIRSPIWRGGGKTFAAKPRDHSQKVNRKMYRAALRSILAELARQDRLVVAEGIELEQPKTKALTGLLAGLGLSDVLIVTEDADERLMLASRNLPKVDACETSDVNPVNLIAYDKILMTVGALKRLEERVS